MPCSRELQGMRSTRRSASPRAKAASARASGKAEPTFDLQSSGGERFDRGELANRQIGSRNSAPAHDTSGRERFETGEHSRSRRFGPLVSGFRRDLHEIRGERVTAFQHVAREVSCEPIPIEIIRDA